MWRHQRSPSEKPSGEKGKQRGDGERVTWNQLHIGDYEDSCAYCHCPPDVPVLQSSEAFLCLPCSTLGWVSSH